MTKSNDSAPGTKKKLVLDRNFVRILRVRTDLQTGLGTSANPNPNSKSAIHASAEKSAQLSVSCSV